MKKFLPYLLVVILFLLTTGAFLVIDKGDWVSGIAVAMVFAALYLLLMWVAGRRWPT